MLIGIFVGGSSSRMGVPKGLVRDADGTALLARLVHVASAFGDVVLVGDASPYAALAPSCPRLRDARSGIGPLGGLVALLRHAHQDGHARVVALSCDLPFVSPDDLHALLDHASDAPIVAARADDAPFEPFLARYDAARVLPLAELAIESGALSLKRLLESAGAEPFRPRPEAIVDWDTPDDVARGGGSLPDLAVAGSAPRAPATTSAMSDVDAALRETLLSLCAIASPIGEEKALCDHVEARLHDKLPRAKVSRHEHSLVVHALDNPGKPRIALVGHLDVVRTQHDLPARIEGEKLYGAGASDMKSGLALMLEAMERIDPARIPYDVTLVFYEREEGPFAENMLGPLLEKFESLRTLDLAICLEPSDNELQLGCMGSVHATVAFSGVTAHSARPWQGKNAFYEAVPFLAELAARAPNEVEVDGYVFREVLTPTLVTGGRGRNVVPDRIEINVNYRFAPGRKPEDAVEHLRAIVGGRGEVIATDLSPAGRPHTSHALVRALADAGVAAVKIKQAWTDVARFDSVGVPGVNWGPGTAQQAHQRNEWTSLPHVYEGYRILERFLTTPPASAQ